MSLADQTCVPCRGGVPPLKGNALNAFKSEVPDWEVVAEHHLHKAFRFPDFQKALDFVNRAGAIAEEQGHHPDISFGWGYATVSLRTKKIKGLHENDFIMAGRIDRIFNANNSD